MRSTHHHHHHQLLRGSLAGANERIQSHQAPYMSDHRATEHCFITAPPPPPPPPPAAAAGSTGYQPRARPLRRRRLIQMNGRDTAALPASRCGTLRHAASRCVVLCHTYDPARPRPGRHTLYSCCCCCCCWQWRSQDLKVGGIEGLETQVSHPARSRGRAPGGASEAKAHSILRIFGCQTMHNFVYLAKVHELLVKHEKT